MGRKSGAARAEPLEPARGGCLSGCLARLAGLGCATTFGGAWVAAGGGVAAIALLGAAYQHYVVVNPGPQFDPKHIRQIIAQESPVTYRDGVSRVGVFFEDEHREYLAWDDLPVAYVAAIVAAEDAGFFTHGGFSVQGLGRAVFQNVTTGSVVSGGSTLTQQTAKNLFYRPDRSLKSKLGELANALKLEAHFEKQDILTFYANQFHVSGNGRGLGIAARYFFDKKVSELTVLECAFLAGLVKGPTNYDPFIQKTEEKRQKAITRAHDRTKYVLRRLAEVDAATLAGPPGADAARIDAVKKVQDEARAMLATEYALPFQEGTFRYDSNAVVDEVARRLQEPPFADVLKDAGIDDPATAGLEVVTTLDEGLQREAVYALWHHLTEAGAHLEAPKAGDWVVKDGKVGYDPNEVIALHDFHLAKVVGQEGEAGKKFLSLDLGGQPCTADRDAVSRAALATYRGERKDKNAKVSSTYVDAFVKTFDKDEVVWVSIRETGETKTCDLERRPVLQGAAVVVQDGQIRAMVGGNDNKNFNRAEAPRQMGSTWKPTLYHAAIELGWLPTDPLDNRENVFPWQGTFYYPTSDHEPVPVVSMAWAGVNSENLASVWLLYHLTDRLSPEQVKALAADVDLLKADTETEDGWKKRIGKLGIGVSRHSIDDAAFERGKADVIAGLAAARHPEDEVALRSLYEGDGFSAERGRVIDAGGKDKGWKLTALDHAWDRLSPLTDACQVQYRAVRDWIATGQAPATAFTDLRVDVRADKVAVACGYLPAEGAWQVPSEAALRGVLKVAADEPLPVHEEPEPVIARNEPAEPTSRRGGRGNKRGAVEPGPPTPPTRSTGATRMRPVLEGTWSTSVATYDAGPITEEEDVLVDGRIHLSTLIALRDAYAARAQQAPSDPWADDNLLWNPEFRVRLGIRFLAEIAARYGVRSELVEGLPLTLGASEITIEEATAMYDGIVLGTAFEFPATSAAGTKLPSPPAPALLIAEIRDVDGNVLYKAEPTPVPVAANPATGEMTFDILANVVQHGTGSRANGAVTASGGRVPLGGKTGTTNEYRNSAFLGFVPRADGDAYVLQGGFAVGVYVGYDDNRAMDVGNIKMSGASGALPAWIGIARGLQSTGMLGKPDRKGSGTWPVRTSADLVRAVEASSVGATILTRERPAPQAPPPDVPRLPKKARAIRVAATDHRKGGNRKGVWDK